MQYDAKILCEDVWKIFGKGSVKVMDASPSDRNATAASLHCTIAVREANLEIREGEVFVIMGLSGSGKSTILRCLNYLIQPSHGRVVINGKDLSTLNAKDIRQIRQEKMGMVKKRHLHAHSPGNFEELKCYGFLKFPDEGWQDLIGCKTGDN